jgi:hypothetical protein
LGCQPFSFCYHIVIVFVTEGARAKVKEEVKEKKMCGAGD